MTFCGVVLARGITVSVAYAAIIMLGAAALFMIPVDLLPSFDVPHFVVRCAAPGMSAEELDRAVTVPLEAALHGTPGLKRTSAVTREGLAVIQAEYEWSVNVGAIHRDLLERTEQVAPLLPEGSRKPTVHHLDPREEPILRVAVAPSREVPHGAGDEHLLAGISRLASGPLRRRLELVDGVALVGVAGIRELELKISVDPGRMRAAGLCPDDLMNAVRATFVLAPAGESVLDGITGQVTVATAFGEPSDLGGLLLRARSGGPTVRLGDIAQIGWSVKEPAGRVHFDGEEVVELRILKSPSANAITTAGRVREEVRRLQEEFPDLRLVVNGDESEFVRRSAGDVAEAVVLGGMLSFAILFFVLRNWHDPLVVSLSYPVSIFGTIFILHLLGIHLHLFSLAGLALGVGMLGDNAVIVAENIRRLVEEGYPVRQAVLEGTSRIAIPVSVSTLTNVAVFLPVLTLEGIGRRLFGEMAVAMTVSLLFSLLVAITMVPLLIDRLPVLSRRTELPAARRYAQVGTRTLERCLRWVIRRRWGVLITALAAMILAVSVAASLTTGATPSLDVTSLEVTLEFPPGTPMEDLLRHTQPLERSLLGRPGTAGLRAEYGVMEQIASEASSCHVTLSVSSSTPGSTSELAASLREAVRQLATQVAGVRSRVAPRPTEFDRLLQSGNRSVAVRITGMSDEEWRRDSAAILGAIGSVRGIADVSCPRSSPVEEVRFLPDPEAARVRGVSCARLQAVIASYKGENGEVRVPPRGGNLPLRLSLADSAPSQAPEMMLRGWMDPGTVRIGLRSLVRAVWRGAAAALYREDGRRVFLVTASSVDRSEAELLADLTRVLQDLPLPAGTTAGAELLSREASASALSIWLAVMMSVLLMYMLLAAEYESVLLPLIILVSSPLAFIGAVAALVIAGEPVGVLSLAGLVITVGAVDNDAVIALDVIGRNIREGSGLTDAIVNGMRLRMRPIVVTSLTTVLGIVPLLVQSGSGSVLVRSLAIPLAGGVIASTIATVLVIPPIVSIVGEHFRIFARPRRADGG